ncbi:multidrug transporter [Roseomonas sp. KE2513]|uniref:MATE family efflux transporter n=1 Tax=Roseomonas sp. KE2513 TaxID=2479202 RepID=UPI0018DF3EF8|nr:MATE family efflux transporter [Roseomonas sp. KE2513]MBI0535253.1 multidrug transporter [Roseomonas sp. KE2513]
MQPPQTPSSAASGAPAEARFVTGSTLRHVLVMGSTGAVGLIAVFAVDLLGLFYLSRLGEQPVAAAVGFAGAVGFFQIGVGIGLSIGLGAVVSRAIGAGEMATARRIAASGLAVMTAAMVLIGLATALAADTMLGWLGATGEVHRLAARYLIIVAPSVPLLGLGMGLSALLRSVGDARRAMNVTLFAALATAVLDPLLIFALGLGLEGAAIGAVLSRLGLAWLAWHGAVRRHGLVGRLEAGALVADARRVMTVAAPAVLTNLATPVGSAWVTQAIAGFGSAAIAGQATIERLSPVAFGIVYALSGAVGPIMAQNLGAGRADRVRATLRDSMLVVLGAVLAAWAALWALQDFIVAAFSAVGETAALIRLFCNLLAGGFLFTGGLFVANAAFNNLGYPLLSTAFNWGRATLGTIPFVALGVPYGPGGVLIGQMAAAAVFGTAAALVAFRVVGRLHATDTEEAAGVELAPAGSGAPAVAALAARADRGRIGT